MKLLLLASAAAVLLPCAAWADAAAEANPVDTVIVTAAPDPEDPPVVAAARARLSETPGSVAVVSAESYAARYAPNLTDLLRDAPGVYAEKKWGGDTRLAIRGSGIGNASHNRGVLLAQDGVPFNEADGYGDFQMIDPLLARYTEVYKGGNALRFGGALLGGAINLVTPTGRDAGAAALARVDGGSFGQIRGHVELAHQWGDWDAFAAVTGAQQDGWRQQSEGQQQYAVLNAGRQFGPDREVRLILQGGYVHQEIPGSLTLAQALTTPELANGANLASNYQRDMGVFRGTLQTNWRLTPSTTLTAGVYGTWKTLDHPIFQVLDQQSRNWGAYARFETRGDLFGRKADVYYGFYGRLGDLDGKQWINVDGSHGAQTAQNRQNAQALDVFGEGRLFVTDQLALVAGGSWGHAGRFYQSSKVPGPAGAKSFDLTERATYDWFAPRVGLLWQAEGGAQVYGNLTRSVEPPNFSSLAPTAFGFTPLKPQDAWTAELGTRGRKGPLVWDVALYRAALHDELLNYTVNVDKGVPAATFNAHRTVHQGVEAGLDWRIAPAWRLRQTYTWSDFRFQRDVQFGDNRLPVVPEHLYRAELRYETQAGWFVAPSVEWAPQAPWADYANTLRSPGYAVANLNLGWTAPKGVRLFLDIRNLFDKRYVSNVTAITDARIPSVSTAVFYPGDKRSIFGGVTWALLKAAAVLAVLSLSAGAAEAHVTLTPDRAAAGAYQVVRFGVGHGCDGKATTALRIEVPAGVEIARPQPKPGWTLSIEHASGGARVSAIEWRGELPPDECDEFVMLLKLPAAEGPLALPAVQSCGATAVRWDEPPGPPGARGKRPAPTLQLGRRRPDGHAARPLTRRPWLRARLAHDAIRRHRLIVESCPSFKELGAF